MTKRPEGTKVCYDFLRNKDASGTQACVYFSSGRGAILMVGGAIAPSDICETPLMH